MLPLEKKLLHFRMKSAIIISADNDSALSFFGGETPWHIKLLTLAFPVVHAKMPVLSAQSARVTKPIRSTLTLAFPAAHVPALVL